jgi:hypothetical protein
MRIETDLVKICFCLVSLLSSFSLFSQDTVNIKPFERYWTKPRLAPKIGVGVQETVFAELGVQWHKIFVHPLSLASAGPYLTVDGMMKDDVFIMGPKLGYEITAGLLGIAVDGTYYTDFDHEAFLITPRAGISILGFVNLFYGRNIPVSEFQFKAIDKNRFSLVFNLNKDYFNVRSAPKKNPGRVKQTSKG